MALNAEQWFPSVIWSGMLNGVDNDKIETFAYDRKNLDKGVQISNYIGWQSNSIKQGDNEEFDQLVQYNMHDEVDDSGNKKTPLSIASRFLDNAGAAAGSEEATSDLGTITSYDNGPGSKTINL